MPGAPTQIYYGTPLVTEPAFLTDNQGVPYSTTYPLPVSVGGTPLSSKAANTPSTLADNPLVTTLSPANTGLPVNTPQIVQKAAFKSTGSVASLAGAFTTNNVAGNTIVVVAGCGNGTAMTLADSLGNTYTQAATSANSTTFETAVFFAVGILAGANTITATNAGSTASMAMEIYEVSGLLAQVPAQATQTATATGNSGTASSGTITAGSPNKLAFAGVGVGTAAQTITPATNWTNDSGQQNPTTPAGLFSFISMSQYIGGMTTITPQATFTSEPWTICTAIFKPVVVGIEGSVALVSSTGGGALPYHLVSAATTNATVVKASPGTIYQITVNGATAALRYVKFYDTATAPTAGSGTIVYCVQTPNATTGSTVTLTFPTGMNFANGIAFVMVTTLADAGNTAVGAGDLSLDMVYK